jgi:uncharacterized membrane protein
LLKRWTALVAAGLVGLGLVLAIAANWQSLGRTQQFGLLQALVLVLCTGAALLPAARAPFSLLGFLAIGGLFAFFGQTYQTGADPWQLFALWAGLGVWLPLCSRSDTVWCAWIVVALTGVSLWDFALSGHDWSHASAGSPVHLAALCAATLPPLLMTRNLHRYTGAGVFAWRVAMTLSAVVVTELGITGMFDGLSPQFWFALALAVATGFAMASPSRFDVYAVSIVGLAVNILLNAAMASLLFAHVGGDIGKLMLWALAAAGLLAGSVRVIMQLSRKYSEAGEA